MSVLGSAMGGEGGGINKFAQSGKSVSCWFNIPEVCGGYALMYIAIPNELI